MMAMAFTAGADALIGCLEAKYLYMLVARCVRIQRPARRQSRYRSRSYLDRILTVNFPEYPSAHACLSTGITDALAAYFWHEQLQRNPRQHYAGLDCFACALTASSTTSLVRSTTPASGAASTGATR